MASLAYNIEAAQAAVNNLGSSLTSINFTKNNLISIFDSMRENGWKGSTSTTFYNNYNEYLENLEKIIAQIRDVCEQSSTAIKKAEELNASIEDSKNSNG